MDDLVLPGELQANRQSLGFATGQMALSEVGIRCSTARRYLTERARQGKMELHLHYGIGKTGRAVGSAWLSAMPERNELIRTDIDPQDRCLEKE